MRRAIRLAVGLTLAICQSVPSVASHPGYLADVLPWCLHHPTTAAQVIESGDLWCQWCGEAWPVEMLGWAEIDGEELLICDGCWDDLTA